jgi:hypothetical protein
MDGGSDGGAPLLDDAGVEGFDALAERLVVDREWALEKGATGEGDQADAIVRARRARSRAASLAR